MAVHEFFSKLNLRLRKCAYGLGTPLCRRALRLGIGASIEHLSALKGRRFRTIVDVGANRGQFALFARTEFPDAQVISFEPLAAPGQLFETLFKGERNVRLHRRGLGRRCEPKTMHITQEDDSSSFYPPSELQTAQFGTVEVASESIEVVRLDSILNGTEIERPALLKIDTQGYELEVIMGCGELLSRFDYIYAELSFAELYEGQPLAGDVESVLSSRGFTLEGTYNQSTDSRGRVLQADFLFANSNGLD
jgi:FkbM family methyltransferase